MYFGLVGFCIFIEYSLNMFFFQHDVKTALFLLPHVLLYVLLDGTQEDVEEVRGQINNHLSQ